MWLAHSMLECLYVCGLTLVLQHCSCGFCSCSQSSMESPSLEFEYGDTDTLAAELSGKVINEKLQLHFSTVFLPSNWTHS